MSSKLNVSQSLPTLELQEINIDGQRLRIGIQAGRAGGTPLLLCNGIGASIEIIAPFIRSLQGIESIAFDVPGVGGSPAPLFPYRFWNLAGMMARLLDRLGYQQVDVFGYSWGGALAQQFAFSYPMRCRKLILAATSTGALSVPGRLSVLSKMLTPRRYLDPSYLAQIAPELYGGEYRDPELARAYALSRQSMQPSTRGYSYQLMAGLGWTSLPWLPLFRQPTLILAGSDDPLVPLVNARLMASLIPRAQLHVVDSGHLFLLSRAPEVVPVIRRFLEGA
jgi:poly(3-hydroxyalkanoate) depolymerase